jgi:hypothetical protein
MHMFVTVTSALLGQSKRRAEALSQLEGAAKSEEKVETEDKRSLTEVIESVLARRLRKLEGLRAYLRSYMPVRRLLGTGAGTVFADTNDRASDTYRTPITKLTQQQAHLKGEEPSLNEDMAGVTGGVKEGLDVTVSR